jgi:hypothetical protein
MYLTSMLSLKYFKPKTTNFILKKCSLLFNGPNYKLKKGAKFCGDSESLNSIRFNLLSLFIIAIQQGSCKQA